MERDSKLFVVHIIDEINFLQSVAARMSFETFNADQALPRAVAFSLQIISEASRRIPSEWLDEHPNIQWHKIKAFGNRSRHEYSNLQMPSLWATIINELGELKIVMDIFMTKPDQPLRP